MLSNVDILQYLNTKDISIDPWHDDMMDSCRISLHLGEKILIPHGSIIIDVKNKILPEYKEIMITEDKPFLLEPGMFILGETFEAIGLSEKICMLMDGRSTLARLGLMVIQTAMIIDAGQKQKKMTLEIKNNGPHAILLYPKMKFVRACFFLLDTPATVRHDTTGKYLPGDSNKPIFKEEFGK